jgi:hypothetical protein
VLMAPDLEVLDEEDEAEDAVEEEAEPEPEPVAEPVALAALVGVALVGG